MTKQQLDDIYYTYREVQEIREIIHNKYDMLKSPVITGMPQNHDKKDKIGTVVAQLDELECRLVGKMSKLVALQIELEKAIDKLTSRERTLMRSRYIEGKTWDDIADIMHYCKRNVTFIHLQALKNMGL